MKLYVLALLLIFPIIFTAQNSDAFEWPEGNTMAVSLTWDDGRSSQVVTGTPLLDEYGIKATFYIVPSLAVEEIEGWKTAVKNGHEIGNHSLNHPCSGNFLWARDQALEEYSIVQMQNELKEANKKVEEMLGVTPSVFAYPCGQTFVGRGEKTMSYVPVIAEQFNSGRTWLDEVPNDPAFCDLSQLTGVEMDGKSFEEIMELINHAKSNGLWLVLAGHDIGDKNIQTTEVEMLKKLLPYLKNPENKIWTAPVGDITAFLQEQRKK
ncbi:polysaccharide deacetylase family protein [Aurantibacter crassamenti]|uniref:polysaccharide deacetylase family protein n=1 Tax=Aurantibacter crassamenti TaxID=1837375 RepID=UPI00193932CA|nr:polysaccharide deacetylase family protein [Aurantibacter crassamenti]MBM1106330.1 polysaccharide deacetylase family protein [Aurantibacter crassamenti]